nr:DUF2382 domain-containing protein [Streptomyces coryli]
MKGGSGRAERGAEAQAQAQADGTVKVTGPEWGEHAKSKDARAPQYSRQQPVEVTLYEESLEADPQLRQIELGKAQLKTKVTSERRSVSMPVTREHANFHREPVSRGDLVEGRANFDMGESVQEVVLHGTDVAGAVHRTAAPYEKVVLEVTPETSHVTVEADCRRQECEVIEPQIAEAQANIQVDDRHYTAREARGTQRQFSSKSADSAKASFSAAEADDDDENGRDSKGRFTG